MTPLRHCCVCAHNYIFHRCTTTSSTAASSPNEKMDILKCCLNVFYFLIHWYSSIRPDIGYLSPPRTTTGTSWRKHTGGDSNNRPVQVMIKPPHLHCRHKSRLNGALGVFKSPVCDWCDTWSACDGCNGGESISEQLTSVWSGPGCNTDMKSACRTFCPTECRWCRWHCRTTPGQAWTLHTQTHTHTQIYDGWKDNRYFL